MKNKRSLSIRRRTALPVKAKSSSQFVTGQRVVSEGKTYKIAYAAKYHQTWVYVWYKFMGNNKIKKLRIKDIQ